MQTVSRHRGLVVSFAVVSVAASLATACTIKAEAPPPPTVTPDPSPPKKVELDNATLDAGAPPPATVAPEAGPDAPPEPCLDDTGPAFSCEGAGGCAFHCDNYTVDYKKGLATEIMKCLYATSEMCTVADQCANKALARACPDPTAADFCKPLVDACAGAGGDRLTQAGCESVAKGLNAHGRGNFEWCVNEGQAGGCKWDSAHCVEFMK